MGVSWSSRPWFCPREVTVVEQDQPAAPLGLVSVLGNLQSACGTQGCWKVARAGDLGGVAHLGLQLHRHRTRCFGPLVEAWPKRHFHLGMTVVGNPTQEAPWTPQVLLHWKISGSWLLDNEIKHRISNDRPGKTEFIKPTRKTQSQEITGMCMITDAIPTSQINDWTELMFTTELEENK